MLISLRSTQQIAAVKQKKPPVGRLFYNLFQELTARSGSFSVKAAVYGSRRLEKDGLLFPCGFIPKKHDRYFIKQLSFFRGELFQQVREFLQLIIAVSGGGPFQQIG